MDVVAVEVITLEEGGPVNTRVCAWLCPSSLDVYDVMNDDLGNIWVWSVGMKDAERKKENG